MADTKPEPKPDYETRCPKCGQLVSVITGKSDGKEVQHHIIGHSVVKRCKKGLTTYRQCRGSGYVSVWDTDKERHVYVPGW